MTPGHRTSSRLLGALLVLGLGAGLTACKDDTPVQPLAQPPAKLAPLPMGAAPGAYNPDQAKPTPVIPTAQAPQKPTAGRPTSSSAAKAPSARSGSGGRNTTDEPDSTGGKHRKCTTFAMIGDSTAILMQEEGSGSGTPGSMGTPLDVLADAGVEHLEYDFLGGRSFVEGNNNGIEAIQRINARSTPDCYGLIMGTNDAANMSVGSAPNVTDRVDRVMHETGDRPVFWVSPVVASTATANGYDPQAADDFTAGLSRYANQAGNDRFWVVNTRHFYEENAGKDGLPSTVDGFFEPDGIHYPSGAVTNFRARLVADQIRV